MDLQRYSVLKLGLTVRANGMIHGGIKLLEIPLYLQREMKESMLYEDEMLRMHIA